MLLALVIVYQVSVIFASPYNQYPFAFLLNTGNEGLDNTNTEQIRVSLPGGSVALRYPAFGYGDTIANVKVIGIDFVKDLKAKIIDGGPGSNYVVLAVTGNSEVPYEVLVTLQTIPNTDNVFENADAIRNEISDPYGVALDKNDSAEDTNDVDAPNTTRNTRMNAELTQQSNWIAHDYKLDENIVSTKENERSNDENYVDNYNKDDSNEFENEVNNNAKNEEYDADDTDDPAYAPDIHRPNSDQFSDQPNVAVKNGVDIIQSSSNIDQLSADDKYNDGDYNDDTKVKVNNLFKTYESYSNNDNTVEEKYYNNFNQDNENDRYEDDPTEIDQMFNDEEVHGEYSGKNNNNNFDTDDTSAVEY